jgi:hypothetical protein
MKKNRILKLFKKGTGTFWKAERGEKNSMLFSSYPVIPLTKVAENRKTESGSFMEKGKQNILQSMQNVDALEFASFPQDFWKTGKQNDVFVPEIETDIPDVEGEKCTF